VLLTSTLLCINNLLFVYHITHSGARKTIEFTLDLVIIRDLETTEILATRVVDHASQLYTFFYFSLDDGSDPLTIDHTSCVNITSKSKFGYLNLGILSIDSILHLGVIHSSPTHLISIEIDASLVEQSDDTLEGLQFLFDDSHGTTIVNPILSLETLDLELPFCL